MDTEALKDAIVANISATLKQVDAKQTAQLETAILNANRIFLAGKGRTGLQMRAFAMRLMHMGLHVFVVDDVTTPGITTGDLLIIASSSGKTVSMVNYARQVKTIGATLATITGNPTSVIAELASTVVYIPATNHKSTENTVINTPLVMGSLFEHTLGLLCDLMVIQLMASLDVSETEMADRHANLE